MFAFNRPDFIEEQGTSTESYAELYELAALFPLTSPACELAWADFVQAGVAKNRTLFWQMVENAKGFGCK